MSRRVLVTGAAGFIGGALTPRLLSAGWEVYATSRAPRESGPGGPIWIAADLSDLEQARTTFKTAQPDLVYHLAGSVGAGPQQELVLDTFHSLLVSTVNVLVCALDAGAPRVVLSSSFTEPGPSQRWPAPGSPYSAAKWAGSAYGRMFHALYGAPVVMLRPFMAYGPGQAPGKLVPSVVTALIRGEAPKLSSGATRADWVFIDDVADAYVAAATAAGADGATIDLGSGALHSVRNVVERLVAITKPQVAPHFGALPDRPAELEVAADTALAASLLGWTARTSLDEGLKRTVEWRRAQLRGS